MTKWERIQHAAKLASDLVETSELRKAIKSAGNVKRAAIDLEVPRPTLINHLERLGLSTDPEGYRVKS